MSRVAAVLAGAGHVVRRVNLCPGDALFWRAGGAVTYRGRLDDWPAWIGRHLDAEAITDLALLGDGRPYQARAIGEAQARGIRVHAIEHGYLRPDWITVERDGLSSASRFPKDPETIRRLALGRPAPDFTPIERESFLRYAGWDVAYHSANMALSWLMTPHYQRYMIDHPLVEYAGWALKLMAGRRTAKRAGREVEALLAAPGPLFLMPLQLSTDYQIRLHSPFAALIDAVAWIVRSFAAAAPSDARLVFKVHPLDNGWDRWPERIAALAGAEGIGARIAVVDGGSLDALIGRASGVVTVNSTVGLTALKAGRPVAVLGNAVYDVPGLTDRQPLAGFWRDPLAPDPALFDDFLRALAWASQVRGEFTAEKSMAIGARAVAERIVEEGERLPPRAGGADRRALFPRREEWLAEERAFGAS